MRAREEGPASETRRSWLADRSVLVTGAAGTVGRGLVPACLKAGARVVRALDHHEHGLFELQQSIGQPPAMRWLLGDVRDRERLIRAMDGVDVVFHAAALKHVGIGEYNPFEIVQTNLMGLQNVIAAALETRVERMIFTSSDKAVNPTNAMGASKLMGERLVAAAHGMRGTAGTRFASVRFGNILGSNGSVSGIFRQQIGSGGPVTLTDRRMTRFVMAIEEAVQLLLKAAGRMQGGEVYVLKMPALRVADLATVMIENLAPVGGRQPGDIEVVEVGSQPGEKLFEELLADVEVPQAFEDDELIVCPGEELLAAGDAETWYGKPVRRVRSAYRSSEVPEMSRSEIEAMLTRIGLLESSAAPDRAR